MYYPFNHPILKERRRGLRKNQTGAEYLLWQRLRNKHLGVRFCRQFSVGPYIMDFYCPKLRLAVELDGNQHKEMDSKSYDDEREAFLQENGIQILRFWNDEVLNNLKKVLEMIGSHLHG